MRAVRQRFESDVVDARINRRVRQTGLQQPDYAVGLHVGHLDACQYAFLEQLRQVFGAEIDVGAGVVVVVNDRDRHRVCDAPVVVHDTGNRGQTIVGRHDQQCVCSGLFCVLREVDGDACTVVV